MLVITRLVNCDLKTSVNMNLSLRKKTFLHLLKIPVANDLNLLKIDNPWNWKWNINEIFDQKP